MGQCSDFLKSEIKGEDGYEDKEMDFDALCLMEMIKQISDGINTKKNEVQAYVNKCHDVWNCIQKVDKSLDTFQKRFRSTAQTTDLAGGEKLFLPKINIVCQFDMTKVNSIVDSDEGKHNQALSEKLAELETAKDKELK